LLFTLPMLLVGVSAFAQGTVSFSNRTSEGDWRIAYRDDRGAGLAPLPISINIYMADTSGLRAVGVSLASTTFRTSPAAATFFVTPIDQIDVPGLAPGSSAQKFIAQFTGANSMTANVPLVINPNVPAGGSFPGAPPAPPGELLPADRSLFEGVFYVGPLGLPPNFPEPSALSLSILGAAVFFLARRK